MKECLNDDRYLLLYIAQINSRFVDRLYDINHVTLVL